MRWRDCVLLNEKMEGRGNKQRCQLKTNSIYVEIIPIYKTLSKFLEIWLEREVNCVF